MNVLEQFQAGTGNPSACGTGHPSRNGEIRLETKEVVQAHLVIKIEGTAQTLSPPYVAVVVHMTPTERGVSPNLPRLGEAVGWGAGDFCWQSRCIELEHLRFAPGIGRIVRDVHGDVADDANAALVSVAFKLAPLAVKTILREGMEACAFSIGRVVKNRDIIARELFFPGMP